VESPAPADVRRSVTAAVAPEGAEPGDEPRRYVANRNSDIFHRPDCKWTRMIKPGNMITFDSVEEAVAQKFHPCRTCTPGRGAEKVRRPQTGLQSKAASR
jgi:methylphosphotriester-DNA--protein-cysteine methyltransferase